MDFKRHIKINLLILNLFFISFNFFFIRFLLNFLSLTFSLKFFKNQTQLKNNNFLYLVSQ